MTEPGVYTEKESRLFAPITINGLALENRIFKAPTLECMAGEDGGPTERLIRFYKRAAKGGSGLLITGISYVNREGRAYLTENGMHEDWLVPGWRRLVDEIHEMGGKIVMQISHGGRQVDPRVLGGKKAAASSSVPNLLHLYQARELKEEEILGIIRDFGAAARRVREAGFDGVQIHASGGYLLAGFLSPLTNRRKDHWGGDEKRRFHFFEEIYKSVRRAAGEDFPVLAKVHLGDFMALGRPFPANYQAALRMQEIGVDALEFAVGVFENCTITFAKGKMPVEMVGDHIGPLKKFYWKTTGWSYKPFSKVKKPYFQRAAMALKKSGLNIPLLLAGGVRRPRDAEAILSLGAADLVGMSRPLLREPDLPRRWMKGEKNESSCTSCNKCLLDMGINANPLKCHEKGGV